MARSSLGLSLSTSTGSYARMLGGFAKSVIPKAATYEINASLFMSRDVLRGTSKDVLDNPTDFTWKNAWGVSMARLDGSSTLKSRIFVKDRQSTYFTFLINGGTRYPGNVGPGNTWLFVPVAPQLIDARGNMRRNVLKGLFRRSKGAAG